MVEWNRAADDRTRLVISDALSEEECVIQDVVVRQRGTLRSARRPARELRPRYEYTEHINLVFTYKVTKYLFQDCGNITWILMG